MPTVQVSARIDVTIKKALDDYCRRHGVIKNHFIQEALLDRLEELEDNEDRELAGELQLCPQHASKRIWRGP